MTDPPQWGERADPAPIPPENQTKPPTKLAVALGCFLISAVVVIVLSVVTVVVGWAGRSIGLW